jgi:hypothetical protein
MALAALLLALAIFGPNLAVKAAMAYIRFSAGADGPQILYETAGAGFLFSSAEIKGLQLKLPALTQVNADLLRLNRPSVINLIRLVKNPAALLQAGGSLAGGLEIENLAIDSAELHFVRLKKLFISSPGLAGGEQAGLPLDFEHLALEALDYEQTHSLNRLELGRLEARKSGGELSLLRLENLKAYNRRPLDEGPGFEVGALTAGGVDIASVRRLVAAPEENAMNILTFCDTLDIVHSVFSVNGEEVLNIKKAFFDLNEDKSQKSFSRDLELAANLAALADNNPNLAQEPAFMALLEATGGSLDLRLNLNMEYRTTGGQVNFRDFRLESPALGRLELGGQLSGVTNIKAGFTPYQLLFTSAGWKLEGLSLHYSDGGFMPALYRALDKTIFKQAPSRQSAANLMDYYVKPLAARLEDESGLANLPALVSETQAFLSRPESLSLRCAPPAPLTVLSLAKLDKYDIIDRLSLSVQVNQRAPVTVMAARGVDHERLPSTPRPLENSFTEENI